MRHCWHVLTKGKAFNDDIILSQKGADKLIDFLLGYKRIPKEKMDKLMEAVSKAFKDKHEPSN